MMMRIILILAMIMLSGCAVTVTRPTTYALTEIPDVRHSKQQNTKILMVFTPDADPYYRSTQIAYELVPHQVSYYTRNAWAELPAQMLQPLLVKTLQNTNHFRAIVAPPLSGFYDYMLHTEIQTLRVNYDAKPVNYQVSLHVQIFNAKSNKVIATRDITVIEPVTQCCLYGKVLAANHAVANALAQVSEFAVDKIK